MIELTEEQWARIVAMLPKMKAEKAKKAKAEAVKADAKEKGKVKALTDKQLIDVIW